MHYGKQAATLNEKQVKNALSRTTEYKNGTRNRLILELSIYAGLRAKEITNLCWEHCLDNEGNILPSIRLTDAITKGSSSGGEIPMHPSIRKTLEDYRQLKLNNKGPLITSDKGTPLSRQSIINLFWRHYRACGIEGASSHSGRRTFITGIARQISSVGGSLNDVRSLARHKNLATTQRYISQNTKAQMEVVKLLK